MIIGDVGPRCPCCYEENALFGDQPDNDDFRLPVAYVKSDENDKVSVYYLSKKGDFIAFPEDTEFECIKCGATWDTITELTTEIISAELSGSFPDITPWW